MGPKYWIGWFLFIFGSVMFSLCFANIFFSLFP